MQVPKITLNECERLKDLFEYEVLDTSPEGDFDELTSLVAHICEAPIALISLIDESRQWFKSRVGLEALQTSRDISFCGHAIHGKDIFEVTNTLVDERFKDNPLVVGAPHIRFYAGMPLVTPRGNAIGTLCVIDKIPRRLTDNQKKALRTLSRQIIDLFELRLSNKNIRQLNESLTEANHRITKQQDALVQSAKLQTMGAMASGVCFELANPVRGLSEQLKKLMNASTHGNFEKNLFTEGFESLDKNIQRIEKMVNTLRQFSHDDDLVVKKIEIHELMHDLMTLVRERFSNSGVKLLYDLPEGGDFKGVYNQISQVLINLLHNAFDAVISKPNGWVKISIETSYEEVIFHITDSGSGIDEAVKKHLFKPFVTTKAIGKGIGLGLYISQGIVENHRGQLFYDESARNTTFTVKFPR
jgi:C4-dicarboxylate-specific signal transduction histidine kinase